MISLVICLCVDVYVERRVWLQIKSHNEYLTDIQAEFNSTLFADEGEPVMDGKPTDTIPAAGKAAGGAGKGKVSRKQAEGEEEEEDDIAAASEEEEEGTARAQTRTHMLSIIVCVCVWCARGGPCEAWREG